MRSILAVLLNTFRETIRDKILYGIVFFAIVLILTTFVLGEWSLHEEVRVTTDLGLAGISLFSVLLAIVLGVSLMHKEIDRKTLYPVLSKLPRRPTPAGALPGHRRSLGAPFPRGRPRAALQMLFRPFRFAAT